MSQIPSLPYCKKDLMSSFQLFIHPWINISPLSHIVFLSVPGGLDFFSKLVEVLEQMNASLQC